MTKHYPHTIKKIADLIPYANNSRTHDTGQIIQIAASLHEYGFTSPVLIDEKGMIIAGHGRVIAADRIDMTEVPCIVLEGLTEAQKKAYVIADNKLALNAGWDYDLLKLEIEHLQEVEFDIDLLGFDLPELEGILGGWNSDIEIPDTVIDVNGFKIKVSGNEVDADDVLSTLKKAIEESGIAGVTIDKA